MKKPILQTVTVNFEGFLLDITGQYEEGDPGQWTLSNGDPGYPPTASNFYIEGVELVKGELLDLLLEVENRGQQKDLLRFFDIREDLEHLVIKKIEED